MENKNQPIRVLHVVTSMDRGGLETKSSCSLKL